MCNESVVLVDFAACLLANVIIMLLCSPILLCFVVVACYDQSRQIALPVIHNPIPLFPSCRAVAWESFQGFASLQIVSSIACRCTNTLCVRNRFIWKSLATCNWLPLLTYSCGFFKLFFSRFCWFSLIFPNAKSCVYALLQAGKEVLRGCALQGKCCNFLQWQWHKFQLQKKTNIYRDKN